MILKDISFKNPHENILFDDVLLSLAEEGVQEETLRFWESVVPFIVLGRVSRADEDVDLRAAADDGVLVLRRSSGGGTVLQGKGCLNYSLVLSKETHPQVADLKRSYEFILGLVVEALRRTGIHATPQPISDIALMGSQKKISGNAQRRLRKFILHHGTVLYDFDLPQIGRYLAFPKSVPEYRQGRAHADFVANVPVPAFRLKQEIAKAFAVDAEEPILRREEEDRLSLVVRASAADAAVWK